MAVDLGILSPKPLCGSRRRFVPDIWWRMAGRPSQMCNTDTCSPKALKPKLLRPLELDEASPWMNCISSGCIRASERCSREAEFWARLDSAFLGFCGLGRVQDLRVAGFWAMI